MRAKGLTRLLGLRIQSCPPNQPALKDLAIGKSHGGQNTLAYAINAVSPIVVDAGPGPSGFVLRRVTPMTVDNGLLTPVSLRKTIRSPDEGFRILQMDGASARINTGVHAENVTSLVVRHQLSEEGGMRSWHLIEERFITDANLFSDQTLSRGFQFGLNPCSRLCRVTADSLEAPVSNPRVRRRIRPRFHHPLLVISGESHNWTRRFGSESDDALYAFPTVRSLIDVIAQKHEVVAGRKDRQHFLQQILKSAQVSVDVSYCDCGHELVFTTATATNRILYFVASSDHAAFGAAPRES